MITDNLSPEELTLLTNLIAIEISKGKSSDEITIIASIYDSISTQMFLIAAQRDYIDSMQITNNGNSFAGSDEGVNRDWNSKRK